MRSAGEPTTGPALIGRAKAARASERHRFIDVLSPVSITVADRLDH
jgi:hypothetical protein